MKVVATQPGQYNQIPRVRGEVFALLEYREGGYPPMEDWIPKLDVHGKEIPDEGEYVVRMGKDKKTPVHRDFAEDTGAKMIRRGPMRGDTIRSGWMKIVPDNTPIGIYPLTGEEQKLPDFEGRLQLPTPYQHEIYQQDRRAAKILEFEPKPAAA